MQTPAKILWVDDEIDLLKPHIIFLEAKGYKITTSASAVDALETLRGQQFDILFLDENMPGMTGLEMIARLRDTLCETPVVMITKSEEESLMEGALGNSIKDYLIKPVNPHQILMAIKKITDQRKLESAGAATGYQESFRDLGEAIYQCRDFASWADIYKKLLFWDLRLQNSGSDDSMKEIFQMQKQTANTEFAKFVGREYEGWFRAGDDAARPVMSASALRKLVFPRLAPGRNMLLVIDNLRFDQWLAIKPLITKHYKVESEDIYCSILPTATQFARNALFAGVMPEVIKSAYPQYWRDEDHEGSKNEFEKELFALNLKKNGIDTGFYFEKASNLKSAHKVGDSPKRFLQQPLSVLVYNFVDILSHARTDVEVVKELASTEPAYRNLTRSWYEHSPLSRLVEFLAHNQVKLFVTTDHGSIRISNAVKVVGDRDTSTNLRYKHGRNLKYPQDRVFEVTRPEAVGLPRATLSGGYVFARENDFFAYPNNYNHYANHYRDTFQHGGVSLEEMLVPLVSLVPNV